MIDFGPFQLATLPRTGAKWFYDAALACGFEPKQHGSAYSPPPPEHNGLVVSIVRHPLQWLASFHAAALAGELPNIHREREDEQRSLYGMYCAIRYTRFSDRKSCNDFPTLVSFFSKGQNNIWDWHVAYQASVVLRLEDLPWAAIEFFESLTGRSHAHLTNLPPSNALPRPPITDPALRQLITASEPEYCGRYNYW